MDKNYKSAMDKIRASEDFKRRTAAAMKMQTPKRKMRRFIPAIAAALVIAVILTVLLIPHTPQNDDTPHTANRFTLTASAAEGAPLNSDSYVEVGAVKWNGGAYQGGNFGEEFLIDISVKGENIDSVTYSVTSGKIALPKTCGRITDSAGKDSTVYYDDGSSGYASVDYDYYDSVTCDYDDPFTAEDGMMLAFAEVCDDFDRLVVQHYFTVFSELDDADNKPLVVTNSEVEQAYSDYLNEILRRLKLNVTVSYTDGSTETKTVGFAADCNAQPSHRKFYAYDLDENGQPYPVHSLKRAYNTFLLDNTTDLNNDEDYNKVKDIFTEDDLIEFDTYDIDVILNARLEAATAMKGGSSGGVPEDR